MRSSNIGGQAVIEGVMMKNGQDYAVAVRKPDQTIELKKDVHRGLLSGVKIIKLPFIRGIFNFLDSMILGISTLTFSASFYEEEEENKEKKKESRISEDTKEKLMMGSTLFFSLVIAIAIFFVLPVFVSNIFKNFIHSITGLAVLEGLVRTAVFIGYILLISRMNDIRRLFMYHGAEHKCINCIEHGLPLTVENVRKSSRLHKRCGTSFLFLVIFISIIFGIFIRTDVVWLRALSRVLLIPVIAGVSYEILKLAGRSESPIINAISKPGLWLQKLTTKEPEDDMIEVAIASVEAVFDWEQFEEETFGRERAGQ